MNSLKAAIINEIDKTIRKKKVISLAILSILLIVFGQLLVYFARNQLGIFGAGSVEFPILVLSVFSISIFPLFTILITIDIFTGERSSKTMKLLLTRPISRFKIVVSKLTAIAFFVGAMLLFVMVLSIIVGLLFNSMSFTIHTFIDVFSAYLVTIVPMLTFAMIIFFLTNIFKSGITVFFVTILLFLLLSALGILFSQFSSIFLVTNLNWFNLWIGQTIAIGIVARKVLLLIGSSLMLFCASYYLFDKREL
jgi:ABC-2 type transport system permease protein